MPQDLVQLASPMYGQLSQAHGVILGVFWCRARTWTLIILVDHLPTQDILWFWAVFFCNSLIQMFSEIYLGYAWLGTVKRKMLNRTEHYFVAKHNFFFLRGQAIVSCSQSQDQNHCQVSDQRGIFPMSLREFSVSEAWSMRIVALAGSS